MSGGYEYSDYGSGGFDVFAGGSSSFGFGGNTFGGSDPMGTFDAGGGFMADNKSSEKKEGSADKKSITPLTINQVYKSTIDGDVCRVDGSEVHTVRILGNIDSMDHESTMTKFRISDGSGVIDCKQWKSNDGPGLPDQLRENTIVKIHGRIDRFNNAIHITVFDVKPVDDLNELTHHLLEVVYLRLQRTRGALPAASTTSVPMQTSTTPVRMGNVMTPSVTTPPQQQQQQQQWNSTTGAFPSRSPIQHRAAAGPRPEQLAQVNEAFTRATARRARAFVTDAGALLRSVRSGMSCQDVMQELSWMGLTLPIHMVEAIATVLCDNGVMYEVQKVNNVKYYAFCSSTEVEALARKFPH